MPDPTLLPAADGLETLRRLPAEELFFPVLVQLVVIILAAQAFGHLARRVGQPRVVGEIFAGVILGPSLVGWLFPRWWAWVFRPGLPDVPPELADAAVSAVFTVLSQLGLILLLFLVGLEFDFSHLRGVGRPALLVSLGGLVLPMALGAGVARLTHPALEPHPDAGVVDPWGFGLFLGVALSITALPTLGRILMDLNLTRTRLGVLGITAAALCDAAGWVLLAAVAAVARSAWEPADTLRTSALAAGFTLVMVVAVRPVLGGWLARGVRRNGGLSPAALAVLLAALFACAAATNRIGIFAICGPFVLGAVLSKWEEVRDAVAARLSDLVNLFFLPIFFTYAGLRTQLRSIDSWELAGVCVLVLAAAVAAKVAGCALAARLAGLSPREAGVVGVMMNTRGLVALVVINSGYDLGVIPPSIFSALVIMSLVTTVMTTPLLLRLAPGTELEAPVRASGFLPPIREAPPTSPEEKEVGRLTPSRDSSIKQQKNGDR